MTEQEIKAELHDLQTHNCNGFLSINLDGWPEGKNCTYCERILELQNKLRKINDS